MATIFIPIEVPDDQLGAFLAQNAAAQLAAVSYSPVGSPTPTPQPAQQPEPPQQGDPWATATPAAQYQQQQAQPQYQQAPPVQQALPPQNQYQQQGQAPVCAHGPMRFVPGGVSGSGKAYGPFYGCSAPRGPGQCKSVRL